MSNFLSSLCILNISPLPDVGLMMIFSHSVVCLFVLLMVSSDLQFFLFHEIPFNNSVQEFVSCVIVFKAIPLSLLLDLVCPVLS